MVAGGKWQQLVPPSVAVIVEALDGRQRLLDAGMKPKKRR